MMGSPLNGPDNAKMPTRTRPGSPMADAPTADGWLLDRLPAKFHLVAINADAPETIDIDGILVTRLALGAADDAGGFIRERYLGTAASAIYLVRPDQHVAARWETYDSAAVKAAVNKAAGRA